MEAEMMAGVFEGPPMLTSALPRDPELKWTPCTHAEMSRVNDRYRHAKLDAKSLSAVCLSIRSRLRDVTIRNQTRYYKMLSL